MKIQRRFKQIDFVFGLMREKDIIVFVSMRPTRTSTRSNKFSNKWATIKICHASWEEYMENVVGVESATVYTLVRHGTCFHEHEQPTKRGYS